MAERSKHQQKIIRDYYRNFDAISLQKLAEDTTELYLAEGRSRERIWKRVGERLTKLEIPPARVKHILDSDNPSLLAALVNELLGKS